MAHVCLIRGLGTAFLIMPDCRQSMCRWALQISVVLKTYTATINRDGGSTMVTVMNLPDRKLVNSPIFALAMVYVCLMWGLGTTLTSFY